MNLPQQSVYYVVQVETSYASFDEALAKAPELIAAHVAHREWANMFA